MNSDGIGMPFVYRIGLTTYIRLPNLPRSNEGDSFDYQNWNTMGPGAVNPDMFLRLRAEPVERCI